MGKKAGQKRKKAEKAKTQLGTSLKKVKKGKRIAPKGSNETKVNLQVKSLDLPTQHHEPTIVSSAPSSSTGAVTTVHLRSLKDLLPKLHHSSYSHRVDGVKGLINWVERDPEESQRHFSQILGKIAPLLYDPESSVRSQVTKFLEYALILVSLTFTFA